MIFVEFLTDKDIGRRVAYMPNSGSTPCFGRIRSWNDLYVEVEYENGDVKFTRKNDLLFVPKNSNV